MFTSHIEVVMESIDYIEKNLTDKLDLERVAIAVHYSKYHLHRIFVENVGITLHNYILRRKLTEAAKLLVFSKIPILEIAMMAGYKSQQAFSNVFKEMYKKSPNKYRESKEFYPLQLRYRLNDKPSKINMEEIDWDKDVVFASSNDIAMWMELVSHVIDGFPGYNGQEYIHKLQCYMKAKRALIMKDGNIAIGIMMFDYEKGSIDFLGVHPQYRKMGIERILLTKVLNDVMRNKQISITTFREGDKADTGYREICKKLGFIESELLIEFGYPTQKFVLRK